MNRCCCCDVAHSVLAASGFFAHFPCAGRAAHCDAVVVVVRLTDVQTLVVLQDLLNKRNVG